MRENKDLEQDMLRGKRADLVLNNEEFRNAFIQVKAKILEEFQKLPSTEVEQLQEAHRKLKTLDWVESTLKQVITDGKIAEDNWNKQDKETRELI